MERHESWMKETEDLQVIHDDLNAYLREAEKTQSCNRQEAYAIYTLRNMCLEVRKMGGKFIKPVKRYDYETLWSPFGFSAEEAEATNGHLRYKARADLIRSGYAFWKGNQ